MGRSWSSPVIPPCAVQGLQRDFIGELQWAAILVFPFLPAPSLWLGCPNSRSSSSRPQLGRYGERVSSYHLSAGLSIYFLPHCLPFGRTDHRAPPDSVQSYPVATATGQPSSKVFLKLLQMSIAWQGKQSMPQWGPWVNNTAMFSRIILVCGSIAVKSHSCNYSGVGKKKILGRLKSHLQSACFLSMFFGLPVL